MQNPTITLPAEPSAVRVDDPFLGTGGRLVVGFDGSAASVAAFNWALTRATRTGCPVALVGVVDDDSGSMGSTYATMRAQELAHLLSDTAYRFGRAHPGVDISTRLMQGGVSSSLVEAAGIEDLIVVGSDATGFARGRVYGSRAVQLAVSASGNVAIIPSVDLHLRKGVVVGVDASGEGSRLARLGALEAVERRSDLVLVHAIPAESCEERIASAGRSLAIARSAAQDECDQLEVASHLAQRRPADAMLNLTRDKALLVVGRSATSRELGVGGALHEVVINANVPIIVSPSR
jgi:nucleotide-binding universal stress UspA family protein